MNIANRKWPFVALGISFLLLAFVHATAWLVVVFIYHANAISDVAAAYVPIYGLMGTAGVWVFLLTIALDVIAGLLLLVSRARGRTLVFVTAAVNLPIIPLGSFVGAAALLMLSTIWRGRAGSGGGC